MTNFASTKINLAAGRAELHDALALTATEVSFNNLPAGAKVPFVHSHKENEELYIVLSGNGEFILDGTAVALEAGTCVRVAPAAMRQLCAGDKGLSVICIQAKAGSLTQFTMTDGVIAQ